MLFSRALVVTLAASLAASAVLSRAQTPSPGPQPPIGSRTAPVLTVDGLRFRDLNRSGSVDPYEDWRLPVGQRVADLVARMTLEEKTGTMMHGTAPAPTGGPGSGLGTGAAYDLAAAQAIVLSSNVTSLITRLSGSPRWLAEQNNALQEIAERSRLGVPLTISTDPRHHFQQTLGASAAAGAFSQWPETLGLAALRDPALVRRFGEVARREYRAVGIHEALSPQADLATEPRWPRINGTFGEDPDLARDLVRA